MGRHGRAGGGRRQGPAALNSRTVIAFLAALVLGACDGPAEPSVDIVRSERAAFRVTILATGLEHPWGAAFLPDGRLLVTERPGRVRIVDEQGRVSAPLAGVPAVEAVARGGLLDIALAPDFAASREVFFCGAARRPDGALTRLMRARLSDDARGFEEARTVLDAGPAAPGTQHYGCRIAIGADGALFLSTGDRNERSRAQRMDDLAGKVLRVTREGEPAPGNPFIGRPGIRPEIYSIGHRNPQGLAIHPGSGALFEAELGPVGGDEINLIRPGANYGWPIVSHGREYFGPRVSGRSEAPGIEAPRHVWVPSVSPSGIAFHQGAAFPGWNGSLFVAALNPPGLVRLTMEGERVVGEERLLWNRVRLRHVVVAPDGRPYILTDEARGRILRLDPVVD